MDLFRILDILITVNLFLEYPDHCKSSPSPPEILAFLLNEGKKLQASLLK